MSNYNRWMNTSGIDWYTWFTKCSYIIHLLYLGRGKCKILHVLGFMLCIRLVLVSATDDEGESASGPENGLFLYIVILSWVTKYYLGKNHDKLYCDAVPNLLCLDSMQLQQTENTQICIMTNRPLSHTAQLWTVKRTLAEFHLAKFTFGSRSSCLTVTLAWLPGAHECSRAVIYGRGDTCDFPNDQWNCPLRKRTNFF